MNRLIRFALTLLGQTKNTMQCLSCKNKQSLERCEKPVARRLPFCGIHMRSKVPRYWAAPTKAITQLQSLWKGYNVRNRLKLGGPGILKRGVCHNEEDMVSCDEKTKVHPFDYFAVEQDGKVWWFDQRTIIEWSQKNLDVLNPFNRTPLTPHDMRRMRKLFMIRKRTGLPLYHSEPDVKPILELCENRWLRVVQIMYECGLRDMTHPEHFMSLGYHSMVHFLNFLTEDTRLWMYDIVADPYAIHSKRAKIYTWLRSLRNNMHRYRSLMHLSKDVAGVLLASFNDIQDPSELAFFVAASLLKTELVV